MKKLLVVISSCLVLVFLFILLSSPNCDAKEGDVINLRFSSNVPKGNPGDVLYVQQEILDKIEKRSNGRIKFETHWMGSLANQREIIGLIRTGTVDMAFVPPLANQPQLPLTSIIDSIPFEPKSLKIAIEAFWKLKDHPAIVKEWGRWNMKIIGCWGTEGKEFASTKPLLSLADIKGVKARTATELEAKIWAAAGGVPVNIELSELYQALDKGIVDAVGANPELLLRFKIKEVVKYYTDIQLGAWIGVVAINIDSLNKLPNDFREIIMETSAEHGPRVMEIAQTADKVQKEQLAREGIQFIEFSAADMDRWRKMSSIQNLIGEWVKDKESKNLPGREVMETYLGFLGR